MSGTDAFFEFNRARNNNINLIVTGGCEPHFHPQVEILCVSGGTIVTRINGETRTLRRGAVAVADSFDIHAFAVTEENSVGHILIIPKTFLSEYSVIAKNQFFAAGFLFDAAAFDTIERLILLLRKAHGDKTYFACDENDLFGKGIMLSILSVLRASLPLGVRKEKDIDYVMRDVLLYLHESSDEKITLGSLAKKFGYTPNHFSHIFNAFAHTGLNEYLNGIRAENAAALLKSGANPSDAARQSGFDSMRTFYRAFAKKLGVPPAEYTAGFMN
jgi:AraC-like DNA-binding protein